MASSRRSRTSSRPVRTCASRRCPRSSASASSGIGVRPGRTPWPGSSGRGTETPCSNGWRRTASTTSPALTPGPRSSRRRGLGSKSSVRRTPSFGPRGRPTLKPARDGTEAELARLRAKVASQERVLRALLDSGGLRVADRISALRHPRRDWSWPGRLRTALGGAGHEPDSRPPGSAPGRLHGS